MMTERGLTTHQTTLGRIESANRGTDMPEVAFYAKLLGVQVGDLSEPPEEAANRLPGTGSCGDPPRHAD
jgi:hypothetical protein